jgi:hypothetical protein
VEFVRGQVISIVWKWRLSGGSLDFEKWWGYLCISWGEGRAMVPNAKRGGRGSVDNPQKLIFPWKISYNLIMRCDVHR